MRAHHLLQRADADERESAPNRRVSSKFTDSTPRPRPLRALGWLGLHGNLLETFSDAD